LLYNANRGINIHHLMVEHGSIDLATNKTRSGLVLIADQKQVEKNWVLFEDANGKLKIIYGWNDLVIGDLKEDSELESDVEAEPESLPDSDDEPAEEDDGISFLFNKTHSITTPPFFKFIRGWHICCF